MVGMGGENVRYGTDLSRGAVNEFLVHPRPISLSSDELNGQDVVEAAGGDEVHAWVRYPEVPVQVSGRVGWWRSRTGRCSSSTRSVMARRIGCG